MVLIQTTPLKFTCKTWECDPNFHINSLHFSQDSHRDSWLAFGAGATVAIITLNCSILTTWKLWHAKNKCANITLTKLCHASCVSFQTGPCSLYAVPDVGKHIACMTAGAVNTKWQAYAAFQGNFQHGMSRMHFLSLDFSQSHTNRYTRQMWLGFWQYVPLFGKCSSECMPASSKASKWQSSPVSWLAFIPNHTKKRYILE